MINNCTADLFITMARKGVCFFDVLMDDGCIRLKPHQKMIASTALDFIQTIDPAMKIVITDDIMISGTSIAEVVNTLLDMGVKEENIQVIVLAVDSENMKLHFVMENGDEFLTYGWSLPNADCIELSSQISNVLSIFGRPYDVDFPVYDPITICKSDLLAITNPNYWKIYNITNSYQSMGGIKALTLIPKSRILPELWKALGVPHADLAHIKIRLFIHELDEDHLSIQVVPFVLFYEIDYEGVDSLYSFLVTPNEFGLKSYKSKFRICQFVMCHRLIRYFESMAQLRNHLSFQEKVLTSLFGHDFAGKVNTLVGDDISTCEFSYTHDPTKVNLLLYDIKRPFNPAYEDLDNTCIQNVSLDGRELNVQILQPFIKWFIKKELPVREFLKDGYHFRKDRNIIEQKIERLKTGYSFKALCAIFRDPKNYYRLSDVLSVFLDRSIDMGIIVPVIYEDFENQQMCRAFRHGEDLPFGISDRSRLFFFLQSLKEQFDINNCDGIAQISFEKIIVLFIQMALREGGIFNQFLGFNNDVLSIRYSVHGTIATKIDTSLTDTDNLKYYYDDAPYWGWITDYLKSKEMIILKEKMPERSTEETIINAYISSDAFNDYECYFDNISSTIKNRIEQYAVIFAEWYAAMQEGNRNKFKSQVIQLSTCFSLPSTAAAIATETHYFTRFWDIDVKKKCFEPYLNRKNADVSLKAEKKNVRSALHSGRDKFEWYERNKYLTTINNIATTLQSKNGYLSRDWMNRWAIISTPVPKKDSRLQKKYYECYCCMLICYACYELISSGSLNGSILPTDIYNRVQKYAAEYYDVKKAQNVDLDNLDELFEFVSSSVFSIEDVERRIKEFSERVDNLVDYANDIVESIQNIVSTQTEDVKMHHFSTCCIVDFPFSEEKLCEIIIGRAWECLPECTKKTQINIFGFNQNDTQQSVRFGIFYETSNVPSSVNEESESQLLCLLVEKIQYFAKLYCVNVNIAVIPELPSQRRVLFQLKCDLQRELELFEEKIVADILPLFSSNRFSQILLIEKQLNSEFNLLLSKVTGMRRCDPIQLSREVLSWPSTKRYSLTRFESKRKEYPVLCSTESVKNSICSLYLYPRTTRNLPIGTATLFEYYHKVYVITCKHCLNDNINQIYRLKMKVSGLEPLYCKPLFIPGELADPDFGPSADEEVAILKAFWDSDCKEEVMFTTNSILNLETINISEQSDGFSCFGYPTQRGATIHFDGVTEANEGYNEYFLKQGERVIQGMSGALILDEKNHPAGILYSVQDIAGIPHAYGIPMRTALKCAKEIIKEGDE